MKRHLLAVLLVCVFLFGCKGKPPGIPGTLSDDTLFAARENAVKWSRAFTSVNGVLRAWMERRDPKTSLLPQYLHSLPGGVDMTRPEHAMSIWTPMNNAADLYPFLAIAAYFTDQDAYRGAIMEVLNAERKLTSTESGLVDAFDFDKGRRVGLALPELIFGTSEYVKDGLVPLLNITGDTAWRERMIELMDAVFASASVESPFGKLPSNDAEVNGEVMQSLFRLAYLTGDGRYFDWMKRMGDAYFLGVLPNNGGLPCQRWNFAAGNPENRLLQLRDHGNEVILGLALVYAAFHQRDPQIAMAYRPQFERMLDRIAKEFRNADGMFYNGVDTSSGKVTDEGLSDNWGYVLCAYAIDFLCHGQEQSLEPIHRVFGSLNKYLDYDWEPGCDGLADSMEGAIYLLNHFPDQRAEQWLSASFDKLLSMQKGDGTVDGTYLDGNYARTVILAGLKASAGVMPKPWRPDLSLGAVVDGDRLLLVFFAKEPYFGTLVFDGPRHREILNLPINPPRINEFPEWFPIERDSFYIAKRFDARNKPPVAQILGGGLLRDGLSVKLNKGEALILEVELKR